MTDVTLDEGQIGQDTTTFEDLMPDTMIADSELEDPVPDGVMSGDSIVAENS